MKSSHKKPVLWGKRVLAVFRRRKVERVLLAPAGEGLEAYDTVLRRGLSRESRSNMTPIEKAGTLRPADTACLEWIYQAVIAAEANEWEDVTMLLERVIREGEHGAVHATAGCLLLGRLYLEAVTIRAESRMNSAREEESHCRELAEGMRGEYSSSGWSAPINFMVSTALGVLDYYADNVGTAKIHMSNAESLYEQAREQGVPGQRTHIGFVHFVQGQIRLCESEAGSAVAYLRLASSELEDDMRRQVYAFLAAAELENGNPEGARRAAMAGLSSVRGRVARDAIVDDCECSLAAALIRLGDRNRAKDLLENVTKYGVDQSKQQWARETLSKLEAASKSGGVMPSNGRG